MMESIGINGIMLMENIGWDLAAIGRFAELNIFQHLRWIGKMDDVIKSHGIFMWILIVHRAIDSLWHNGAMWHWRFWSTLVKVMTCCLIPLPKPVLSHHHIYSKAMYTLMSYTSVSKLCMKFTNLKSHLDLPGHAHNLLYMKCSDHVPLLLTIFWSISKCNETL